MKNMIRIALLAMGMLAACNKDEIVSYSVSPPPPPPPPDTSIKISPQNNLSPPYLAVLIQKSDGGLFWASIKPDGKAWDTLGNSSAVAGDVAGKGNIMVVGEGSSIYLIDLASGNRTLLATITGRQIRELYLNRDGSTVACLVARLNGPGNDLFALKSSPGSQPVQVNNPSMETNVFSASISPDGNKIAYCANGIIMVLDMSGEVKYRISNDKQEYYYDTSPLAFIGDRWPLFLQDNSSIVFMSNKFAADINDDYFEKAFVAAGLMQQSEEAASLHVLNQLPGWLPGYNEAKLPLCFSPDGSVAFWGSQPSSYSVKDFSYYIYSFPMSGGQAECLADISQITGPGSFIRTMKYIEE